MKKRLSAFALAFVMLFGLLPLSGCKDIDNGPEDTGAYATRGQWISMLAEAFALDTYRESTPYYTDIGGSHDLFPAIQATSEWDILSIFQGDTLNADEPVTRSEVASTAAFAAGFKPEDSSFDESGQYISGPSIDYAIAHGLVEAGDLSGFMSEEECTAVIELAKSLYLNGDGEEKVSVIYNKNIVDLTKTDPNSIEITENSVTFLREVSGTVTQNGTGALTASIQTEDGIIELHVGDTFIAPPMEGQQTGSAYRVTSIEEMNRGITVTTELPDLGDLFDELVLHTTLSLDESYITWADGVTVSPATPDPLSQNGQSSGYNIEVLPTRLAAHSTKADYLSNNALESNTYKKSIIKQITLGKGAFDLLKGDMSSVLKFSDALEALDFSNFTYEGTPSISDFIMPTESWEKKLTREKKSPADYKIEGTISLDLEVTPDIEYHKWGLFGIEVPWPESASLTVNSNIATALKVEGSLEGSYEIARISIPTAIPGLTIDGSLSLFVGLNRAIQAKVEFQNVNRVEWQTPLNFRHASEGKKATQSVQALSDLTFGPDLSLSACAFSVPIVGLGLKLSGDVNATGTLVGTCTEHIQDGTTTREYAEAIHLQSGIYFPLISLTASGPESLADAFGMQKTWDIVDQEKAHYIPLWDKEYPLWSQTVEIGPDGEIIDPAEKMLSDLQNGDFSSIAGTYAADMQYAQNYDCTCPDITIDESGTVTGGGMIYSWGYTQEYAATPPISVVPGDDGWGTGTFQCFVMRQEDFSEYYIIYPAGVPDIRSNSDHSDVVRIRYVIADGGIADMIYTKAD